MILVTVSSIQLNIVILKKWESITFRLQISVSIKLSDGLSWWHLLWKFVYFFLIASRPRSACNHDKNSYSVQARSACDFAKLVIVLGKRDKFLFSPKENAPLKMIAQNYRSHLWWISSDNPVYLACFLSPIWFQTYWNHVVWIQRH